MVEIDGETYLIATEASAYIGISRCQFYNNVKPYVRAHKLGARRRLHYKQSELEVYRTVQVVA